MKRLKGGIKIAYDEAVDNVNIFNLETGKPIEYCTGISLEVSPNETKAYISLMNPYVDISGYLVSEEDYIDFKRWKNRKE